VKAEELVKCKNEKYKRITEDERNEIAACCQRIKVCVK
jgi:hypothetical protein